MALTDIEIRKAKKAAAVVKLSDGGGLQLHVMPTGSKLWRLAYRFAGKQKQLALGAYSDVGLAEARTRAEAARALLRQGTDPSVKRKLDRLATIEGAAATFSVVADQMLAKLEDRKDRRKMAEATIEKKRWLIDMARPSLGKRPIADITSAEILVPLRAAEARGHLETARRLRAVIGQVIRHAITEGRAENDPTIALRRALETPTVQHRAAIIDAKAFGGMLRAIDGMEGQATTRAALQLLALLFVRPGELRLAEWTEFDLDAAIWRIPGTRTKMRRPHEAPLPRQAVQILRALHEFTGRGKFVFPSVRTFARPISENTLNAALRRLGIGKDEHSAHGFRATASTLLNESGKWNPDAIERALAHVEEDETRRAYARGKFWSERVEMGQWWADHLDTLRTGAKVIPLPKHA